MKTFSIIAFVPLFFTLFLSPLTSMRPQNILERRIEKALLKSREHGDTPLGKKWGKRWAYLEAMNKEIVKEIFKEEYQISLEYLKHLTKKYGEAICNFLNTELSPADNIETYKKRYPLFGEIMYLKEMAREYHTAEKRKRQIYA